MTPYLSTTRLWLVAVVGVVALIWAVVRPDQMVVERIELVGASHAHPAELRHLADVRNGTLIWQVDVAEVAEAVQRHPWVEAVHVERRLPGTLVVRVQEHTAEALLAFGDDLYYVDQVGRPFLRAHSGDLDFPVITGVDAELGRLHPELPKLVVRDALWLLRELDGRSLIPRSRVSEIRFRRTQGFTVQTTGSVGGAPSARVLIGVGDYERQLTHLAALLDHGVDLSQALHVDVAPQRAAIVRPISPSTASTASTVPGLAHAGGSQLFP